MLQEEENDHRQQLQQLSSFDGRKSAFDESGYKETVDALMKEVQELYLSDSIPWVVGYSGGKDSTAILQLVWLASSILPRQSATSRSMS